MSSFVTAPCPACGPTEIGLDAVVLEVGGSAAVLTATCPACGAWIVTGVESGMDLLLATVGVELALVGR